MVPATHFHDSPSRWHCFSEGVIEACWLVALMATPVFFVAFSDRPFDPSKSILIRTLATMAGAAWLSKVITGGRPWRPANPVAGSSKMVQMLLLVVVLNGASLLLSTVLSPMSWISWNGGYQRSLGTSTQLSSIVLFLLVTGHLRARSQLLRLLGVVWWGSVPVCLFALLQSLGLDPIVRGAAFVRPSATLGNPIFLGAYVGFTFFLGLGLLHMLSEKEPQGVWHPLRQGVLIAVCGLQLWTLAVTASRGPILGVLTGLGLLALLGLAQQGWPGDRQSPRSYLALGLLVIVAATAIPAFRAISPKNSSNSSHKPRVQRVSHLLNIGSRSAQVRVLLWQGVLSAHLTSQPLQSAEGEDHLHKWRRWLGYGPESAAFALAQHQPPELSALETDRIDRISDQAHNQLLQTLLAGGLLGLASRSLLYLMVISAGAVALGAVKDRAQLITLWGLVTLCAAAGAALPWLGWDMPELSALGGFAGGLAAFCAWLVRAITQARVPASRNQTLEGGPGHSVLAALLLAALLSHGVEAQFGIVVTTVMLYQWLLLAALLVLAGGWLEDSRESVPTNWPGIGIPAALFPAILAFVFGRVQPLLPQLAGLTTHWVVGWLVVVTVTVSMALPGERRELQAAAAGAFVGIVGLFVFFWGHSLLAERTINHIEFDQQFLALAHQQTLLTALLLMTILGATLFWGWRIARISHQSSTVAGPPTDLHHQKLHVISLVGLAALLLVGIVVHNEVRRFEELILVRGARSAARGNHFEPALELLAEAQRLRPQGAHLALLEGQMTFNQAQATSKTEAQAILMERARKALKRALRLAPYDADHVANLAHWNQGMADHEQDQNQRRDFLSEAVIYFEKALTMRPSALAWRRELASVHRRLGNLEAAITNLERVHHILPEDVDVLLDLAAVYRGLALGPATSEASGASQTSIDEALHLATVALELEPQNQRARQAVQELRNLKDSGD